MTNQDKWGDNITYGQCAICKGNLAVCLGQHFKKEEQWEEQFDKKFIPKYPYSGFEPINGLTANMTTVKSFIRTLLSERDTRIVERRSK